MPFEIEQVPRDADFLDIFHSLFDSFQNPAQPLLQLVFPVKGPLPADREAAITEGAQRTRDDYQKNTASVWVQVVDKDTGKVAGAAEWLFFDADPYTGTPDVDCVWFSEDEDRTAANDLFKQFLTPRKTYMRRAHAFMNTLFTHPDYRQRGIGGRLVDWGIREADARGLGSYTDATEMGIVVYEKKGFIGKLVELTLEGVPDTPRRKELEKKLPPIRLYASYRPVGGRSPSDSDPLPWEA